MHLMQPKNYRKEIILRNYLGRMSEATNVLDPFNYCQFRVLNS